MSGDETPRYCGAPFGVALYLLALLILVIGLII